MKTEVYYIVRMDYTDSWLDEQRKLSEAEGLEFVQNKTRGYIRPQDWNIRGWQTIEELRKGMYEYFDHYGNDPDSKIKPEHGMFEYMIVQCTYTEENIGFANFEF